MANIMRRLAEADCLVIASPLHFTSLTAPTVAFISRLQPWWCLKLSEGRKPPEGRTRWGALLASGGSKYDNMFRPARSVAAAAFRVLGLKFAGAAGAAGSDETPVGENAAALEEIRILAERISS